MVWELLDCCCVDAMVFCRGGSISLCAQCRLRLWVMNDILQEHKIELNHKPTLHNIINL